MKFLILYLKHNFLSNLHTSLTCHVMSRLGSCHTKASFLTICWCHCCLLRLLFFCFSHIFSCFFFSFLHLKFIVLTTLCRFWVDVDVDVALLPLYFSPPKTTKRNLKHGQAAEWGRRKNNNPNTIYTIVILWCVKCAMVLVVAMVVSLLLDCFIFSLQTPLTIEIGLTISQGKMKVLTPGAYNSFMMTRGKKNDNSKITMR